MRIFVPWTLVAAATLAAPILAQDHAGHGASPAPATPPVERGAEEPRIAVEVPPVEQGRMGLRIDTVKRGPVTHEILTIGTVAVDEATEAHVHTRVGGWVERLYADTVGKTVEKGDPLVEIYSPDLLSAAEEYLSAARQNPKSDIATAALSRLRYWSVPQKEIDRLVRERKARRTVTLESPVRGVVIEKPVLAGMYVTPERELFRIADLSRVWVLVTLYEADVAVVKTGDGVDLSSTYDASLKLTGTIEYVYPQIELETRVAKARVAVANPEGVLKPGMFMNVKIRKDLGTGLTVPDDAVIDTGERAIVFVRQGGKSFEPRQVELGPRIDRRYIVRSGLVEGEEIVTSAHFLIDAESRLQAALKGAAGAAPAGGHSGHGG